MQDLCVLECRELKDQYVEAAAACSLGCVYQAMGESERALEFHQLDLRCARDLNQHPLLMRAYGSTLFHSFYYAFLLTRVKNYCLSTCTKFCTS